MRKSAVVLVALLVVASCGGSSDQAATTINYVAPPSFADLALRSDSYEFLPVAEDFEKAARSAGLLPPQENNHRDPEFEAWGGSLVGGEFCPGLPWMAAALNDKKVSIRRMSIAYDAHKRALDANTGLVLVYVIAVTAIHDVDVDEFGSVLDDLSIAAGAMKKDCEASVSPTFTNGPPAEKFSVVRLRGADLDTGTHKIQIAPIGTQSEYSILRSWDFGEGEWGFGPEWIGGYDGGEFVTALGSDRQGSFVDVQTLLHLESNSTALHIRTTVLGNEVLGQEEFSELEMLVAGFSVDLADVTTNKLSRWLATQASDHDFFPDQ